MRLTRMVLLTVIVTLATSVFRAFPADPVERALVVCQPLQWLMHVAYAISSSMDDGGRIGPVARPWNEDVHRSCVRVAERVFQQASWS